MPVEPTRQNTDDAPPPEQPSGREKQEPLPGTGVGAVGFSEAARSPPFTWKGDIFFPSLGLLIAGAIPVLIVFANTEIKDLTDRFLGGCVFVLDKSIKDEKHIKIVGNFSGKPPTTIPLQFEATDASLDMILFDNDDADREQASNLARHPLHGLPCPGALCPEEETTVLNRIKLITLNDLRPEFSYSFVIWMSPTPTGSSNANGRNVRLSTENLHITAPYPAGLAGGVCRVEERRWFNFWVWASTAQKTILFLSILVVGGLMLRWSKVRSGL